MFKFKVFVTTLAQSTHCWTYSSAGSNQMKTDIADFAVLSNVSLLCYRNAVIYLT